MGCCMKLLCLNWPSQQMSCRRDYGGTFSTVFTSTSSTNMYRISKITLSSKSEFERKLSCLMLLSALGTSENAPFHLAHLQLRTPCITISTTLWLLKLLSIFHLLKLPISQINVNRRIRCFEVTVKWRYNIKIVRTPGVFWTLPLHCACKSTWRKWGFSLARK